MPDPAAVLAIAVTANTSQANAALAKTQGQLTATSATANRAGTVMKGALLGVGVAAGAAGVALFKIGEEFDKSYDKIRTQTGATGKDMRKLKDSFRTVVQGVPADFDTVSTAIAGVHQRLGLTGRPLEKLTRQLVQLSKITHTDIQENVESVTRLFGDWSVKTQDQKQTLDGLYRVTQRSGISLSDLSRLMVQFGSPLRQLGFDFENAAAMFATFEQQGVNIQTLMPGLRFALKSFSGAIPETTEALKRMGVNLKDPQKALADVMKLIKDAPTDLKANQIAFEVFGVRAGPDMAAAIREGRFSYEELMRTMRNGKDTIDKAERSTRDFDEQWQLFKNRTMVALEPLATKVFGAIGDQMQRISRIMSDKRLSGQEKFNAILAVVQDNFEKAIDKAGEYGPRIAGALLRGIASAWWHSDIIGKLFLTAAFIRIIGGKGALTRIGVALGTRIGTAMGLSTVATAGPKITASQRWAAIGGNIGTALGIAAAGHFLNEWDKSVRPPQLRPPDSLVEAWEDFSDVVSDAFPGGEEISDIRHLPTSKAVRKDIKAMADAQVEAGAITREEARHTRREFADYQESLRDQAHKTSQKVPASTRDTAQKSSKDLRDLEKKGSNSFRDLNQAGKDKIGDMGRKVTGIVGGMVSSVVGKGGFGALIKSTNDALGALKVKDKISYKPTAPSSKEVAALHQRGAFIGGVGSGDKVPAMLEPGEFVLNKNAVKGLGRARVEAMNNAMPRFAKGGAVGGLDFALGPYDIPPIQYAADHAGGNAHVHITGTTTPWVVAIGRQLQRMGFLVGEHPAFGGVGPGHSATGGHYDALAIDVNSAAHLEETRAEVASIARILGGSGIGGGVAEKLARIILKGPKGPLRSMGQAGLDRVRSAANTFLSKQAPTGVAPKGMPTKGSFSVPELEALWRATGSNGDPNLMARIGYYESAGGNPRAVSSAGARGLWQIISSTWDAYGKGSFDRAFDPVANATAAHAILAGQGLGAWDAWNFGIVRQKGGGVPSFGMGTDFITNGRMLMEVGERGPERVQVTPTGGASAQPVYVEPPQVHVYVSGEGIDWDEITHEIEEAVQESDRHNRQLGRMG